MLLFQEHYEGYGEIKPYYTNFLGDKVKLFKVNVAGDRAGSGFWFLAFPGNTAVSLNGWF